MTIHLTVMQNDVAPVPLYTILDQNGNPLNLTNASVTFHMTDYYTGEVIVNAAATILQLNTNAATFGQVAYYWQTSDTATPGLYLAWWIVNFGSGPQHTPPDDSFLIMVNAKF